MLHTLYDYVKLCFISISFSCLQFTSFLNMQNRFSSCTCAVLQDSMIQSVFIFVLFTFALIFT